MDLVLFGRQAVANSTGRLPLPFANQPPLRTYSTEKGPFMVHTQDPAVHRNAVDDGDNRVTGWVGWVFFAGIILMTSGFFNIIQGLVALVRDDFYLVGSNGLVLSLDYTAWGWLLLLSGALFLVAGYGVMVGQTWARATGVVLAVLNAVVNMVVMPAYPIWSIIVITLDVFIIYALVVHGREAKRVNP
jgi:hypothetical protein